MTTAIYLAHLNPLTNAHVKIIKKLQEKASRVVIMPVIFRKRGIEINSKSFPFSFESRKEMIMAVFGDSVDISDRYKFNAPFVKYLPPFVSIASWMLRQKIVAGYGKDYFTYTGDRAEAYAKIISHEAYGRREGIHLQRLVKEAIYRTGINTSQSRRLAPIYFYRNTKNHLLEISFQPPLWLDHLVLKNSIRCFFQ